MRTRIRVVAILLLAAFSLLPADANDAIVVVDDRGEAIVIEHVPQRIVAIGALYAQVVVDLSAAGRLVAAADSPENPQAIDGWASVGPSYAPSVETILSLNPDLVLGATDWGGERPALEAAGITVLTTSLMTSIPDVLSAIRTIGEAIGSSAEADALIGDIAEAVVTLETDVLGMERIRCAFLYPPSPGTPPYVAGSGSIENELILRAGGVNVFDDVSGFPQVNLEDLLSRDPEIIFTAPSQVSYITDDPLLQQIAAVRSGCVFGIEASRAASSALADVLAEMVLMMHPE